MSIWKYNIPANKKSLVENYLIKLNKKADRLNLEQIKWTWNKAEEHSDNILIPLEISGPLYIGYNGWDFIATIQHLESGENIFYTMKNIHIPDQYKTAKSDCQHCNVFRYRIDTYLLFNKENENYMQVGSSCIKDFLKCHSFENLENKIRMIASLSKFLEGASHLEEDDRSKSYYIIRDLLAITSACINDYGWISSSKATETCSRSTSSRVKDVLFGTEEKKSVPLMKDYQLADETIDWVESLDDSQVKESNYLYNIRTIVRSGMSDLRTMNLAVSSVQAYNRHKQSQENKNYHSSYVGTIKKRDIFTLTLKKYVTYNSYYGLVHKYLFEDNIRNIIIWSATSKQNFDEGKNYLVKGTVKSHYEYKGVKQTEINRCEIIAEL
jgi:hypothetical protein